MVFTIKTMFFYIKAMVFTIKTMVFAIETLVFTIKTSHESCSSFTGMHPPSTAGSFGGVMFGQWLPIGKGDLVGCYMVYYKAISMDINGYNG